MDLKGFFSCNQRLTGLLEQILNMIVFLSKTNVKHLHILSNKQKKTRPVRLFVVFESILDRKFGEIAPNKSTVNMGTCESAFQKSHLLCDTH